MPFLAAQLEHWRDQRFHKEFEPLVEVALHLRDLHAGEPLANDGRRPELENRAIEPLLAAEVIIDERYRNVRRDRDLAHRRAIIAKLREKLFGRQQDTFLGAVAAL
ncbi:hypothetical protein D3C87_1783730 [compost metagenome]